MKKSAVAAGFAAAMLYSVAGAQAACVTKAANATSGSESSAKWFVMETMVQAVSWGLWPGFVAANPEYTRNWKVEGYKVSNDKYQCKSDGGQVTCRGSATFCSR